MQISFSLPKEPLLGILVAGINVYMELTISFSYPINMDSENHEIVAYSKRLYSIQTLIQTFS